MMRYAALLTCILSTNVALAENFNETQLSEKNRSLQIRGPKWMEPFGGPIGFGIGIVATISAIGVGSYFLFRGEKKPEPKNLYPGIDYHYVARVWQFKFGKPVAEVSGKTEATDKEKAAATAAQAHLDKLLPELKKVDGVKSVYRLVCGERFDFKIVFKIEPAKVKEWTETTSELEKKFFVDLNKIDGITIGVDDNDWDSKKQEYTQNYTFEEL